MNFYNTHRNKRKDSSYYRVLETLWKYNLLKLDETEEGTEYEYIAFSIVENVPSKKLNDYEFACIVKMQFNFWCGYKIPCKKVSDFIPISQCLMKMFKQKKTHK